MELKFKVKGVIRQGTIEGWDKATMTSFLRSSFDGNRRQAAAVVQTTIHTISNEARMAVYEANDDPYWYAHGGGGLICWHMGPNPTTGSNYGL